MAKNRKAAEDFILKYIAKLIPGKDNVENYKRLFASMNDKQFDEFMNDLQTNKKHLVAIVPNYSKNKPTVENNLALAAELGHNFFEKIWIEGKDGLPSYLTPIPYMVIDLPLRRASQLLVKKIQVPDNQKVVDAVTGQPTGESKGARLSYPELQVLAASGLDKSLIELMKYRGGDEKGNIALTGMISKFGSARQDVLKQFSSGVESTKTLKTLLAAAHLRSTL